MRTRQEFEEAIQKRSLDTSFATVEILLDIRELLLKKEAAINSTKINP
jgi:hypothetical protein